jgi:hypothetical protein
MDANASDRGRFSRRRAIARIVQAEGTVSGGVPEPHELGIAGSRRPAEMPRSHRATCQKTSAMR